MTNETELAAADANPHVLDDEDFEALEELLTSDVVPEDCMNLEMLDGFLAGVLLSPERIEPEEWLRCVWTAHGDEVSFGSGSQMQRAIRLVKAYYNELAATLGEPEGWEPFCYASGEGEGPAIGEEWVEGFAQGLELWPEDWDSGLPEGLGEEVGTILEALMAPWLDEAAAQADDEARLQWLEDAMQSVARILAMWRSHGLAQVELLAIDGPSVPSRAAVGRNDPCPCGSGKKFKKCCGALV